MSITFYDGLNQGTTPSSVGTAGTVSTFKNSDSFPSVINNIALQGFYLTYGPADEHNVSWVEAIVTNTPATKTDNKWVLNYNYKDFMTDGTGPSGTSAGAHNATGYIKSLLFATFS